MVDSVHGIVRGWWGRAWKGSSLNELNGVDSVHKELFEPPAAAFVHDVEHALANRRKVSMVTLDVQGVFTPCYEEGCLLG